ncbi:ATP synthase F0 subunit B [Puteibacter caeruleilacunae]|nr:ATP synthase F0 subunit B [Puteibacter caeruleilacunae]
MIIIFIIVWVILKRFAWKPLLNALKEREDSIADALSTAEKAKLEMSRLKADNERIIREAQKERDLILKEAKDLKNSILEEAKKQAKEESKKILAEASKKIEEQKAASIAEMKKQIVTFSVDIAEKILSQELSDSSRQEKMIKEIVDDIKFN